MQAHDGDAVSVADRVEDYLARLELEAILVESGWSVAEGRPGWMLLPLVPSPWDPCRPSMPPPTNASVEMIQAFLLSSEGTSGGNWNIEPRVPSTDGKLPATAFPTARPRPVASDINASYDSNSLMKADHIPSDEGVNGYMRVVATGPYPHAPVPHAPDAPRSNESIDSFSLLEEAFPSVESNKDETMSTEAMAPLSDERRVAARGSFQNSNPHGAEQAMVTDQDVITCSIVRCACRYCNHVGNTRYRRNLDQVHPHYARAQYATVQADLEQRLIEQVRQEGGRFLLHCEDGSWREMTVEETETKVRHDLTQRCFVTTVNKALDFTEGRGEKSRGRKLLLEQVKKLAPQHVVCGDTNKGPESDAKHKIAQGIVNWLYDEGGRFLLKSSQHNQWYIADNTTAVEKVKQKLREAAKAIRNSTQPAMAA